MKERIIQQLLLLILQWTLTTALLRLDIKVYPVPHSGHSYEAHQPEVPQPYEIHEPYEVQDRSEIVESAIPPSSQPPALTTLEPPTYKDLAPIKPKVEDTLDPKAAREAIMAALKEVEKKDRTTLPKEDIYSRNVVRDRIQDIIYGPPSKERQYKWYKSQYASKKPVVEYHLPGQEHLVAGHVDYPGIIFKKYKKPINFEINIPSFFNLRVRNIQSTVTVADVPEWAQK